MSGINLDDLVLKSKEIITQAGSLIEDAWHSKIVAHTKDGGDIVTDIDVNIEAFIREKLSNLTPDFGYIVEEGISDSTHEYNWSIDPIDGTKYFANKVPMFYTQIALLKGSNPLISLIYQPISRQLFYARKERGAYLNGIRLTAPIQSVRLDNTIIDIDSGDMRDNLHRWKKSVVSSIGSSCYRLRMSGGYLGPALVTGAVHAYVNTDLANPPSIKNIVDLAPHQLLVEEAGYTVKTIDHFPQTVMIWATPQIAHEIGNLLTQVSVN